MSWLTILMGYRHVMAIAVAVTCWWVLHLTGRKAAKGSYSATESVGFILMRLSLATLAVTLLISLGLSYANTVVNPVLFGVVILTCIEFMLIGIIVFHRDRFKRL